MNERPDCGGLIKQISDEMRKKANNAIRSYNITLAQLGALIELERAPDGQRSLKELEKLLHVAQSTAAGIIARLEQKGFVQGFEAMDDRRVKLVRITPDGQACVHNSLQKRNVAEEEVLGGLTEAEQKQFYILLKKVRDSIG